MEPLQLDPTEMLRFENIQLKEVVLQAQEKDLILRKKEFDQQVVQLRNDIEGRLDIMLAHYSLNASNGILTPLAMVAPAPASEIDQEQVVYETASPEVEASTAA